MYKILEATYHQGHLILKDKLSQSLEGKPIKIIVLEESDSKKENFLEKVDKTCSIARISIILQIDTTRCKQGCSSIISSSL